MRTLTLDMRQYDCPFIDTSDDHDVSFTTLHWDFKQNVDMLETRMVVDGADQEALENSLQALTEHSMMHDYDLLSKRGSSAHIRNTIDETNAMEVIRDHDGYITGPFHIEDGTETWNVGFDSHEVAEAALSGLDSQNDFEVVSEKHLDLGVVQQLSRNVDAASTMIEGCQELSDVERRTLRAAVDEGYFDNPREATLATLAEKFDVSNPAVSKNLRRAQRKAMGHLVEALDELR